MNATWSWKHCEDMHDKHSYQAIQTLIYVWLLNSVWACYAFFEFVNETCTISVVTTFRIPSTVHEIGSLMGVMGQTSFSQAAIICCSFCRSTQGNATGQAKISPLNCLQMFVVSDWTKNEEEEADKKVWEDNWDDDDVEDDFSQQLRSKSDRCYVFCKNVPYLEVAKFTVSSMSYFPCHCPYFSCDARSLLILWHQSIPWSIRWLFAVCTCR